MIMARHLQETHDGFRMFRGRRGDSASMVIGVLHGSGPNNFNFVAIDLNTLLYVPRLDTSAANTAPGMVLSPTQWSTAVKQNKAQGSTMQHVSTIQTKRMSFVSSLTKR
jgi:hypothetical protein